METMKMEISIDQIKNSMERHTDQLITFEKKYQGLKARL